ncbi:MAG TPA: SNF2-related protein [Thermoanaerobaculia bacterium]|nr:SNF2-related protein [Thermoanaerobaculia bacterium]
MLAETALRQHVSRGSAERGDEYFARGRVRRVEALGNAIEADVQGSRLYTVDLTIEDAYLDVHCSCPWYVQHAEPCKHIWAAIRAASAKNLLPDRRLSISPEEPREDDFDNVRAFTPREQRAPWERFLEALGPATAVTRHRAPRNVPDEIAYVLLAFARAPTFTLQILGRARKKTGEWGKWKPLSMHLDDLHLLSPFDRETLALLHQRSYLATVDATIPLAPATTAWWVERLARAGRLFLHDVHGEPQPIAWDDGPSWTFRVAIVSEGALYRITGTIEREGESLPLTSVNAMASDILLANGRASRFRDGGRAAWLHPLRASGPIEVPHADAERFRQALLRAPIGDVALPEELGWELVESGPKPLLALRHDAWSAELHAELFFVYGDWRVSSRSAEAQTTIGRKLIRRDRAREDAFRTRLSAIGVIATFDGYRVRLQQLEDLARTLTAEKWQLEIDSSPVRVTEDFEVEISSGIDWFDLDVHASFGDVRLGLPELLAAAEAKRSLLRLSDGSFGIVPASWSEALTPVVELGKVQGDTVRFRNAQALLIDALLRSNARTSDVAFDDLRTRLAGASPEPRMEPPTLTATLRPYQRAGLGWLEFLRTTGVGGCLADDMGLGKTVQTLALLENVRRENVERASARSETERAEARSTSLVVAPRSLLFNWAAEARKFAPRLRVLEHHGTDRDRNVFDDFDLVLTTYATMRLDVTRLAATKFEYVILDEAQAIKNASSQVAKASRLLRGKHRLALSGTPIENHLGELWSLFEFLNPGLLGSVRSFNRTFAAKNAPPERREALARALRPLILRRTKEQVAPELPERTEQTLYCELEGKQKQQYEELRDHYRDLLLGRVAKSGIEKSRMQILEALLRLRQAACHPALIDAETEVPSAKSELLLEELRDVIASGHRALVFSQFTSFLDIVRRSLDAEHVHYLYLDGRTRDRQSLVEEFQRADGPPLFLISLKAGGLGLNLTNADYIFLLDPWWNPAVEAQAIDRAHRIGRTNPVVAYRLIARDTVEEKILELQARKRELAESIISEDNSVLRKLEVEDLELLLS